MPLKMITTQFTAKNTTRPVWVLLASSYISSSSFSTSEVEVGREVVQ